MIKYFKRHEIDDEKWNQVLASSHSPLIYATTYFLDVVCSQWDALILDNYTAIMPLPVFTSTGKFILSMPFFTQQLGIFSPQTLSSELIHTFLNAIPAEWEVDRYLLNSSNHLIEPTERFRVSTRINYELNLNPSYDELKKKFSKGVLQNYKKAKKELLILNDLSESQYMLFCCRHAEHNCSDIELSLLAKLIQVISKLNKGHLVGVIDGSGQLYCVNLFLNEFNRIFNLFPVSSQEGKRHQAMTFLMISEIKQFAGKDYIFDFEGGMVPGLAVFYSSFGAEIKNYYQLKGRHNFVENSNILAIE